MLFEQFLIVLSAVICFFLIVLPAVRLIKSRFSSKNDALEDAQVRFEKAKKDVEAARLNKQTEKLYEEMYQETLEESENSEKGHYKR